MTVDIVQFKADRLNPLEIGSSCNPFRLKKAYMSQRLNPLEIGSSCNYGWGGSVVPRNVSIPLKSGQVVINELGLKKQAELAVSIPLKSGQVVIEKVEVDAKEQVSIPLKSGQVVIL